MAEPSAPKRGRRSELTDPQLHNRRDQLVQAFEAYWSQIGRELQTIKKAGDLANIFAPLCESYVRDMISVFRRFSTEPPSGTILGKARTQPQ